MATTWKAGDVVQLGSRGPAMTVTFVDDERGLVHCTWMTTTGEVRWSAFVAETLRQPAAC